MEQGDAARGPEARTTAFLTYVLLPAWAAAGLLDWYWHRTTAIERTSGAHESLTHLLMGVEGGVALALGVFCEIDAGVVAAIAAAALVHEATAAWDVGYTIPRRVIRQREQHTHSFLETLPFATVAFVAAIDPERARTRRARFRVRRPPLPLVPVVTTWTLSLLAGAAPHVEEFVRCLTVRPTLAPVPPPPSAANPHGES
jgi:hypothetical protein